jgi:hypothetical protein
MLLSRLDQSLTEPATVSDSSEARAYDPAVQSSRLRISVLGPLELAEIVNDRDVRSVRPVGGSRQVALLLALVFYPEVEDWIEIERLIKDEAEVDKELGDGGRGRIKNRVQQAASRLRDQLGPYRDVLTEGKEGLSLVRNEQRLIIDWDEVEAARKARRHRRVVSLIRGVPLAGVSEERGDFVKLGEIRETVRAVTRRSLVALDLPTPEPLRLGKHLPDDFKTDLPSHWHHRPQAIRPTFHSPPPRHRRISENDPSRALFAHEELFASNSEGEDRLTSELREARAAGSRIWWEPGDGKWFGAYYAFRHSPHRIPADQIRIDYAHGDLDSGVYEIPTSVTDSDPPVDGENPKAVIVESSNLFGDNLGHKRLVCGITSWNFAQRWASRNGQRLLESPSRPSVFGIGGRPVYPGIAGAHVVMRTSDEYFLFGLRGKDVDYYPSQWSASFEESFSVLPRDFTGPPTGDAYLSDVVLGGLYEEWGIEEDEVADMSCLATGRQFVRVSDEQLDLSSTAVVGLQLQVPLATIWSRLDQGPRIRDRDEHKAWAGCRFASRSDVMRFIVAARKHPEGVDLLQQAWASGGCAGDLQLYPGGATEAVSYCGFMPTSPVRLFLGSAWLWEQGQME